MCGGGCLLPPPPPHPPYKGRFMQVGSVQCPYTAIASMIGIIRSTKDFPDKCSKKHNKIFEIQSTGLIVMFSVLFIYDNGKILYSMFLR